MAISGSPARPARYASSSASVLPNIHGFCALYNRLKTSDGSLGTLRVNSFAGLLLERCEAGLLRAGVLGPAFPDGLRGRSCLPSVLPGRRGDTRSLDDLFASGVVEEDAIMPDGRPGVGRNSLACSEAASAGLTTCPGELATPGDDGATASCPISALARSLPPMPSAESDSLDADPTPAGPADVTLIEAPLPELRFSRDAPARSGDAPAGSLLSGEAGWLCVLRPSSPTTEAAPALLGAAVDLAADFFPRRAGAMKRESSD